MQFLNRQSLACLLLLMFLSLSCNHAVPRLGMGGRYEEGKEQFYRGRTGNMDVAIVALETVVSQDPTYKDSMTYLGRAYYNKRRYQDAYALLQRAVVVNREDEIGWIAFGLTQLRLGQNEAGIESLKGGITIASKVMVDGYHDHMYFDTRGLVHAQIRRCAFLITKGIEEKSNILSSTERLLTLIDDEENSQRNTRIQNTRQLYGK